MNTLSKTLIALSMTGMTSASFATQFYIDTSTVAGVGAAPFDAGVCAGCSSLADQLSFNYNSETIVDRGADNVVSAGDSLTTTAGFNVGGIAWDPNNVNTTIGQVDSFSENHVSGLVPSAFTAGLTSSAPIIDGGGGEFGLGFSMNLNGTVTSFGGGVLDINYGSGTIEVWAILNDPVDAGELIARNIFDLSVTSSGNVGPNFVVNGVVSTSGNEDAAFAQFFKLAGADCAGDNSFVGLTNCMPPIEIAFELDQNLDSPVFIPDDILNTATLAGDHNGSIDFKVPEPAPLALIGLGLFGVVFARRKKA